MSYGHFHINLKEGNGNFVLFLEEFHFPLKYVSDRDKDALKGMVLTAIKNNYGRFIKKEDLLNPFNLDGVDVTKTITADSDNNGSGRKLRDAFNYFKFLSYWYDNPANLSDLNKIFKYTGNDFGEISFKGNPRDCLKILLLFSVCRDFISLQQLKEVIIEKEKV
jgi:hypothetical protein